MPIPRRPIAGHRWRVIDVRGRPDRSENSRSGRCCWVYCSFSPPRLQPGSVVEITVVYENANAQESAAPAISISIRDHGPGIPESDMAHVLEPFHRPLRHAYDGDRESNGLRLPLTRMLMERHGGELVLSNAPGGGLKVEMRFPPSRTRPTPTTMQQEEASHPA